MANCVNVLEEYYATPETTGGGGDEMSVQLTYFDIPWIDFAATIERLIFYELPGVSRSQFLETYVPKLKYSLSSTLKDFLPLAGNLIILPSSDLTNPHPPPPEIRYRNGDRVSIVFTESLKNNFEYLTADNCPRNSCEFYPLIPQLPIPQPLCQTDMTKISPVLAVQVTLFPGAGICLGVKMSHVVGDGMSVFAFFKTWALRSKLHGNGDEEEKELGLLLFDRSKVIKDPKGLASLFLNQLTNINPTPSVNVTNKIRQKFVLSENDIKMLKNIVCTKRPNVKHLSAFTVTYAYVWLCLVKYDRIEYPNLILFAVDCRGRVNPPIPLNYFGNCLTFFQVHPSNPDHQQLINGDVPDAFSTLVDKIGEKIHNKLLDKDRVLDDAETWITQTTNMDFKRTLSVAGSPRYNYYHLDFGWGKPITSELVSIDQTGAICLSGCRDSEAAGIEICLSTSREKLEAFSRAFHECLLQLLI